MADRLWQHAGRAAGARRAVADAVHVASLQVGAGGHHAEPAEAGLRLG